jgi:hypothetical protein
MKALIGYFRSVESMETPVYLDLNAIKGSHEREVVVDCNFRARPWNRNGWAGIGVMILLYDIRLSLPCACIIEWNSVDAMWRPWRYAELRLQLPSKGITALC